MSGIFYILYFLREKKIDSDLILTYRFGDTVIKIWLKSLQPYKASAKFARQHAK